MKASDQIRQALKDHLGLTVTGLERQRNTSALRHDPFIVRWTAGVQTTPLLVVCYETMTECARELRAGNRFAITSEEGEIEVATVPPSEVDASGRWTHEARRSARQKANDAMRAAALRNHESRSTRQEQPGGHAMGNTPARPSPRPRLSPSQRALLQRVADGEELHFSSPLGRHNRGGYRFGMERPNRKTIDALIKQDLLRMLPGKFGQHGTTIVITDAGREALGAQKPQEE